MGEIIYISKQLLRSKETTVIETLVLSLIHHSMLKDAEKGCDYTDGYLSNEINVTTRTIKNVIRQLESKGFIKRETKPNKTHGGKNRKIFLLEKFYEVSEIEKQ